MRIKSFDQDSDGEFIMDVEFKPQEARLMSRACRDALEVLEVLSVEPPLHPVESVVFASKIEDDGRYSNDIFTVREADLVEAALAHYAENRTEEGDESAIAVSGALLENFQICIGQWHEYRQQMADGIVVPDSAIALIALWQQHEQRQQEL